MKLNPTKCKEMLINFMSNHNFIVNHIVIGSNTIERVMAYKLLGVYVSNDPKWNHHVEVIVQKGNRSLYSLRVLKQCGAPPASLAKVLYNYCSSCSRICCPCLEKYTRFSIL